MKQLYLIFALSLFFACSQNPKDASQDQMLSLTFELDTVMVDAGEDLIYLRSGLHWSGLSADGKSLFIFNNQENKVEVIDMENLHLTHKIHYEREGPNGTGNVFGFQNLNDGKFLFADYNSMGIFNEMGEKSHAFKFSELSKGIFKEDEQILPNGILSDDGKFYFCFYSKGGLGYKGIVKLDMQEGSLKRIPVEELVAMDKFTVELNNDSQQMKFNMVGHYIEEFNGKVLLSNTFENKILVYHPDKDSLSQHSFHSLLTPDFAKDIPKNNADSQKELQEIRKEFGKEASFGKWHYDSQKGRYYRLTSLLEKDVEDQKEYKVVLTVLDKELRQIYEGITPLKKNYFRTFIKGGKLYAYENMEDELGFIVLTLNEN